MYMQEFYPFKITVHLQLIADEPELQISCYGICKKFVILKVLIL